MKQLSTVLSILLLFTFTAAAQHHGHHKHRAHKAHVHGTAKLSIAFDGAGGEIEFESPSESIYGFEHEPKTDADKKAQQDALTKLETDIATMVSFAKDLNCMIVKQKIDVNYEDDKKHSEVEASYKVTCVKSPADSTITFNLQKSFPKLKTVEVQVLVGTSQQSLRVKTNGTTLKVQP